MLRNLRRKLRLISYYSRKRERSVWTRAIDLALAASLFLALPAQLIAESMVERAVSVKEVFGILIGDPQGEVEAPILEEERGWSREDGTPYGEWSLKRYTVSRGWPFATKTSRASATVDFNIYEEPQDRVNVQLAPDAPERLAIEQSLMRANRKDLRDGWRSAPATTTERRWLHSAIAVAAWWMMLFVASAVVIRTLSLSSLLSHAKRTDKARVLARTGICASCKYDLRGLEFSARCPECGTLIE